MAALAKLGRNYEGLGGQPKVKAVSMSVLSKDISEADDTLHASNPEPGTVVQVFRISSAGIVLMPVCKSGDEDPWSVCYQALPANNNSGMIRSFLALVTRGIQCWSRLGGATDWSHSIS